MYVEVLNTALAYCDVTVWVRYLEWNKKEVEIQRYESIDN